MTEATGNESAGNGAEGRFARLLTRAADRGALATTLAGLGRPYASLVAVASDWDGGPLLLLSGLSDHSRNIAADARVSLLVEAEGRYANPQEHPRLSLVGRVGRAADQERARQRFLARHPRAAAYAGFGDFAFFKMAVERGHWVGGFGRARWLDRGLTLAGETAAAFAAAEARILDCLNQAPDLLDRLGRRHFARQGGWRAVTLDQDGIDLARARTVRRLAFDEAVFDPAAIPDRLRAMDQARS